MIILGFESSCDETSVAVVKREEDGFSVLSNIVASQIETHRLYGGVVPEIASRAHIEVISKITYEALEEAGVTLGDVGLVAVTANPGLIGALLVGVNYAKAVAFSGGIPLVGVDHIKGHVAASYLCQDNSAPKPPFIAFVASGGHTAIYEVSSYTDYKLIGTTRDDAIGESYDKIGRMIGIPYPAGRGFDELSREGFVAATADKENFYAKYRKSEAYVEWNIVILSCYCYCVCSNFVCSITVSSDSIRANNYHINHSFAHKVRTHSISNQSYRYSVHCKFESC